MSAIDQIKRNSGITIDATNPSAPNTQGALDINMVDGNDSATAPSSNVMNLGNLRSGAGRHQVVLPKDQQVVNENDSHNIAVVNPRS